MPNSLWGDENLALVKSFWDSKFSIVKNYLIFLATAFLIYVVFESPSQRISATFIFLMGMFLGYYRGKRVGENNGI